MQGNYTRYLANLQRDAIERARTAPLRTTLEDPETYPHVVYGINTDSGTRYGVENAHTGERIEPEFERAGEALQRAALLKAGEIQYPKG